MDYVKPQEIVREMVNTGGLKLDLPVRHLLIRGALAGGYLGDRNQYGGHSGSRNR